MTEIKTELDFQEIEMLRDFMDPDSRCGIDEIHLQWSDELHSLLTSLGHIVTQPNFQTETWRQTYNLNEKKANEESIPNNETILYCVGYSKKEETTTIMREELWGNQLPKAQETAKNLSLKYKCDILITYTPMTIIETVHYREET